MRVFRYQVLFSEFLCAQTDALEQLCHYNNKIKSGKGTTENKGGGKRKEKSLHPGRGAGGAVGRLLSSAGWTPASNGRGAARSLGIPRWPTGETRQQTPPGGGRGAVVVVSLPRPDQWLCLGSPQRGAGGDNNKPPNTFLLPERRVGGRGRVSRPTDPGAAAVPPQQRVFGVTQPATSG